MASLKATHQSDGRRFAIDLLRSAARGVTIFRFFIGLTLTASSFSTASAQVTDDEVNAAALIQLCQVRAEGLGLAEDVKLWGQFRGEYISDEAVKKAEGALAAVEASLSNIDPSIIERRCNEGMADFLAPDAESVSEIDPRSVALQAELNVLIKALSDELFVSGYGPSDQTILLDHFVALGNHYGIDDVEAIGTEGQYAFELAIEAVKRQRKAFGKAKASSKKGKALLLSSDYCIDMLDAHLFTAPSISEEGASAATVRHLLFQGLKAHRRAIGGQENTKHLELKKTLEARSQKASQSVNEKSEKGVDPAVLHKTLEQTLVVPLCLRGASKLVVDLVGEPLSEAEKKVSRGAVQ